MDLLKCIGYCDRYNKIWNLTQYELISCSQNPNSGRGWAMFCASFGDLGPWKFCHLSWALPQVVLGVNIQPADGERKWRTGWEVLWAQPGKGVGDFLLHSIDQNAATQPHSHTSAAAENGTHSPACVCWEEKERVWETSSQSLSLEGFRRIAFLKFSQIIWDMKKT